MATVGIYDSNSRKNIVYELNDISFETMDEYKKYVSQNYDIEGKDYEITIKHHTKADVDFCKYLFVLVYIIATVLMVISNELEWSGYSYKKIRKIVKALKEQREAQQSFNMANGELIECINELMEEINKNDELKNRFNELYEKNRFSLDDVDALYEKVNSVLDISNVAEAKKLVREKKE